MFFIKRVMYSKVVHKVQALRKEFLRLVSSTALFGYVLYLVSQFSAFAQTTTPYAIAPKAGLRAAVSADEASASGFIQGDPAILEGSDWRKSTTTPLIKPAETQRPVKRLVRIVVNVPYTKMSSVTRRFVTHFVAYPYPVQPPRIKKTIASLPTPDSKAGLMRLKSLIQDVSYNSRTIVERPYPAGGLRFKYAYQKALQKSGLTEPQTLIGVYPFIDQILPYVIPEVKKYNRLEDERLRRYKLAIKEFEENRADIETDAMGQGLFPIEIKTNRTEKGLKAGDAELTPGTWWIVGTLRIPSLTYYWQLPVSITSTSNEVVLNQENAMLIEGGW